MAIQHAFLRRETTVAEVRFWNSGKNPSTAWDAPQRPGSRIQMGKAVPSVLERVHSSTENQPVVLERLFEQGRIP